MCSFVVPDRSAAEDARLRPIRLRTIRLRPAGRHRIGRSRNWPKSNCPNSKRRAGPSRSPPVQLGHPIVAPNTLMSCLMILSLWIRAPSNGIGGIGVGSTRASGLSTVHLPHSNHVVNCFCVPSVLRFQSPNFASSERTVCIPDETLCTVVSHSKANSELMSGVHLVDLICGGLVTNSCVGFFPCSISNDVFPSRPF